jgi:hypothetical protein
MTTEITPAEEPDFAGTLLVYDDGTHLEASRALAIGDTLRVIRGSGPREGDDMGTATITGFEVDGSPVLSIHSRRVPALLLEQVCEISGQN